MANNLEGYLKDVCDAWKGNGVDCEIRLPTEGAAKAVPLNPIGISIKNPTGTWTIIGAERIVGLPEDVLRNFDGRRSAIIHATSKKAAEE